MTTFTPTHDVVTEATAAGFFPPRHNVEITQVTELTDRVMRLTFRDPFIASHAKPAQFVNLFTHDDFMLMPRPFGVSEVDGDEVSVIFAVVGHGTEQLAGLQAGDTVDVLGPLGRGFNLKEDANYILVGGGLGVPPLIYAAQKLAEHDASFATAVFGYRNDHFAEEYVSRYADWSWSIDDAEGNVVDEWVSGEEPHEIVLDEGSYTLREEIAPEGYLVANSVDFEVCPARFPRR